MGASSNDPFNQLAEPVRTVGLVAVIAAVTLIVAACGDGSQPAAPPAGRIAFVSDRDGGIPQVYVMKTGGSDQTNLTNHPDGGSEPWWSPDGERIAFTSQRDGKPDIFLMNRDGSAQKRLTDSVAADGRVRFSPDGKKIAYYSFRDQPLGFLWAANLDMSEAKPVLGEIDQSDPKAECAGGFPGGWFPDGKRILFHGANGETKALQICSANADGTDIKVIFSEPDTASFFPTLSPDAKKIAFVTNRDGDDEIYVIGADGKGLRRITKDDGNDTDPTWSPDGQWIAFASDRDGDFEIFVVRADGTGLRQITSNTASDNSPAWAPR